ncbi:MAG TPA: NUDIX domain-containing protein [Pyrinomonadaceae bacterium]|nr:NUDIX domain-containing protein [Pyrinomonadaceae bacterium]
MLKTRSAGGIVLNPEGRVLVVSQKGTSWSLPKGHIEEGENELEAARREIYEESGISHLELIKELGSYQRFKLGRDGREDHTELKTIHLFLFRTNETTLRPVDPDNPEARWLDIQEAAELLTHPHDRDFFRQCIPIIQT